MVTKLGMSDLLGPIKYGSDHGDEVFLGRDFSSTPNYSEQVAAKIDSEIHAIIEAAYNTAKRILNENIDKLHFIADFLVKHETMDGDQFVAAMDKNATEEELLAIAEEKKKNSETANRKQAEKNREEERMKRMQESENESDKDENDDDGDGNRYTDNGSISH